MSDRDQRPYSERYAARVGGRPPDDDGGPADEPTAVLWPGAATDEFSGQDLRSRLITAGVAVLLVVGAAAAAAPLAAAAGVPGDRPGSGRYANPPYGGTGWVGPPVS